MVPKTSPLSWRLNFTRDKSPVTSRPENPKTLCDFHQKQNEARTKFVSFIQNTLC